MIEQPYDHEDAPVPDYVPPSTGEIGRSIARLEAAVTRMGDSQATRMDKLSEEQKSIILQIATLHSTYVTKAEFKEELAAIRAEATAPRRFALSLVGTVLTAGLNFLAVVLLGLLFVQKP